MHITQVLVNTFVWAGELGVIALGLSLSYAILRFFNFAQPEFLTVGGYAAWVGYQLVRLPLIVAVLVAMVVTGFVAICIDFLVFRRMRTFTPAAKMIASVGVAFVMRMIIQMIFSGQARNFAGNWQPLTLMGAYFSGLEVWVVGLSLGSMVFFYFWLSKTSIGRVLRATADNMALAESRGINTARVISIMWFVSGALGALGGILLGMETQLVPSIGLNTLVPMFAAATVGGFGSAYGAVAGALVLALAQNIVLAINFGPVFGNSAGWFVPTDYKDVVALLALIVTLLIRPRGLFGSSGMVNV